MALETGMTKNPIVMAISGAASMLLYGGMIGVFISAFVKRPPVTPPPSAQPDSNTDNTSANGNNL